MKNNPIRAANKGTTMQHAEGKHIKTKGIDSMDHQLIRLLQKDGRLSHIELAKKIGISETTVRTRLKRLIDEEFIQVVAVANPLKLGFEVTGDLYIHAEMKKISQVISELKKFKELWYIVMTTGETNINAEFVVKDFEALNDLIFNRLGRIDGVIRTEVSVIMKYEKRAYDFGTPEG
jgi:Lrp/AsnC family transcriptional regulator, regulator for asnA, asnC and gidA